MNAFWWVVAEIYTTWETLTQNFDANSTNERTNERTNEHTNGRMDERKGENYIPVGINAGGITIELYKRLKCPKFACAVPEVAGGKALSDPTWSEAGPTLVWLSEKIVWNHACLGMDHVPTSLF